MEGEVRCAGCGHEGATHTGWSPHICGEPGCECTGFRRAGDDLDLGIRRTVAMLNSWGWRTTDSGDGKSKRGTAGEACMMPFPNVVIMLDGGGIVYAANKLADQLREIGIDLGATRMDEDLGQEVPVIMIEATYNPVMGFAHILLTGVDDAMLEAVNA